MTSGDFQNTGNQSQQKTQPVDPLIGKVLDARYELVKLLGRGGMGAVYQANHLGVGKLVAVKIMHAQYMLDERATMRFKHEVKAMSSLSHPNLIGIIDAGTTEFGSPYFVMEFLPSRALSEIIQEEVFLGAERAKPILMQIADALAHAHDRHIIHRDLKPPNILVIESGTRDHVKVVDLGVAKLIGGEDDGAMMKLTRTGEVFGSPLYMAPEQVLGRTHDGRTDIYQLGCVAFEMLTGVPPHVKATAILTMNSHVQEPAPKFTDIMPDLPMDDETRELERIVLKCLQKDPSQRFQTMRDFIRALEHGLQPEQSAAQIAEHSLGSKQRIQVAAVEERIAEAQRYGREKIVPSGEQNDQSGDLKMRESHAGESGTPSARERQQDEEIQLAQEKSAADRKRTILLSAIGVFVVLMVMTGVVFATGLLSNKNQQASPSSAQQAAPLQPTSKMYEKTYPVVASDLSDLHVLSVYEGKLTADEAKRTDVRAGRVMVDVQGEGRPMILVLNSYQPTTWTISRANKNVQIRQVISVGYYPQEVDGLPPKTKWTRVYYPYFNQDGTESETATHYNAIEPFHFLYVGDEDVLGSREYAKMKDVLEKMTKCHLRNFQGTRMTESFVVK